MTSKEELRTRLKAERAQADSARRSASIGAACARLMADPVWGNARCVALYAALPGEPDLTPLVRDAHARGVTVALPCVARRAHPLVWRTYEPGVALVTGRFRVPVPPPTAPLVDPTHIDLVVVPALGVDVRGTRLGYGGGYYDRTLPGLVRARRIWIGEEHQVLAHVPGEAHDIRVHALITATHWRDAHPLETPTRP